MTRREFACLADQANRAHSDAVANSTIENVVTTYKGLMLCMGNPAIKLVNLDENDAYHVKNYDKFMTLIVNSLF